MRDSFKIDGEWVIKAENLTVTDVSRELIPRRVRDKHPELGRGGIASKIASASTN